MKYEVYINQKSYLVSRKIYLCHATGVIDKINNDEFYNQFILNYRFKNKYQIIDYINMYLQKNNAVNKFIVFKEWHKLSTSGLSDLYLVSLMAEYAGSNSMIPYSDRDTQINIPYLNRMLNMQINYLDTSSEKDKYTQEYKNIVPLLDFYHCLANGISNNRIKFYKTITRQRIKRVLEHLGYNFNQQQLDLIHKDINRQGVLINLNDDFCWSSWAVANWFDRITTLEILALNLQRRYVNYFFERKAVAAHAEVRLCATR